MSMLKREPKSLDKIQRRPPPKKKPSNGDGLLRNQRQLVALAGGV